MTPSGWPGVRWTASLLPAVGLAAACGGETAAPAADPDPPAVTRLAEEGERVRSVISDVRRFRAPEPRKVLLAADRWRDAGGGCRFQALPWPPLGGPVLLSLGEGELSPVQDRAQLQAEGGYLLVPPDQTWTSEQLDRYLEGPPRPGQGGEPESLFLRDQQPVTLPLEAVGEDLHLRLAVFLPREVPVRLTVSPEGGEALEFEVTQVGWQILEGRARVQPGFVPTRLEAEPLGDGPVPPRLLALARVGVRAEGPARVLVRDPAAAGAILYHPRLPHPRATLSLAAWPDQEVGLWSLGGELTVRTEPPVAALTVAGSEVLLDGTGRATLTPAAGLALVRAPGAQVLHVDQPMARLQPFLLRSALEEGDGPGPPELRDLAGTLSSAGDRRRGLWLPSPTQVRLAADLAAGARVRFSAALLDPPVRDATSHALAWEAPVEWQPSDAVARVVVTWEPANGAAHTVFDGALSETGWQDVDWPVPATATGPGELVLASEVEGGLRSVAVGVADPRVMQPDGERPPWNVLLYLVDTLRADGLSSYGAAHPTTPVLDRIAAEGYRFARFQSVASWTRPTAASILTGLYPAYHGILTARNGLSADLDTMAEVLAPAGYSNWAGVANIQVAAPGVRFDQGFHRFLGVKGLRIEHPELQTDPSSRRVHDAFLPWLDRYGDEPWFLYLHTMDPHMPYLPPPGFEGRFDADYDGVLAGQPLTDVSVLWQHVESLQERDVAFVRNRYLEEVRYQDEEFGRLWRHLEDTGQLERTILVLLSDHGEEFYEHQRFSHQGRMWDELLHVPLILWVPPGLRQRLGPPRVIPDPLSQVDLLPTLLDLLEVEDRQPRQGRSLVPLLSGGTLEDTVLFAQEGDQLGAVLAGPWKLVWHQQEGQERRFELYHRGDDPEERQDLAAARPELVERLWQQHEDWQQEQAARGLAPREGAVATFDLEALEELRALGYLK